jgi:hypothetical protein
MSLSSSGASLAPLASPPNFPSATACGFFFAICLPEYRMIGDSGCAFYACLALRTEVELDRENKGLSEGETLIPLILALERDPHCHGAIGFTRRLRVHNAAEFLAYVECLLVLCRATEAL